MAEPNWETVKSIKDNVFRDEQGWWFLNELEQPVGCFGNEMEAIEALTDHTLSLSGPNPPERT